MIKNDEDYRMKREIVAYSATKREMLLCRNRRRKNGLVIINIIIPMIIFLIIISVVHMILIKMWKRTPGIIKEICEEGFLLNSGLADYKIFQV